MKHTAAIFLAASGLFALTLPVLRDNGDGTVTDTATGLVWQQADGGEMTWEKAGAYCKDLALGEHGDWRLPFAQEAFSIMDHNASRPAMDTSVFTRSEAEYWWTAETLADDPGRVWVTNAGGGIGPHPKRETVSAGGDRAFHVRCVRSAAKVERPQASFTDNGDGTATDNHTGLVWQQQASEPMAWEDALAYAERLEFAGHGDWRVPNIRELQSLNDTHVTRPSLNRAGFPGAAAVETWSSTAMVNHPARAWTVDFTFGIGSYRDKTEELPVRCVRGPQ